MRAADDQNPNENLPETGGMPGNTPVPDPSLNRQASLLRRLDELGLLDDPKFAAEVLSTYLRDGLQTIEDLEAAIRAQDAAASELLAHRIKGASLNLGAERLGNIALALETLAADGDLSKTGPLLEQLREEFESVRACLLQLPGMPKAA
jgi:HPt (histidine-containing phosphotransfer) domain-containing protein